MLFRPLQTTSNQFRPLQTTSINHFKPFQVPNAASTNHFEPIQSPSNEFLGLVQGYITIHIKLVSIVFVRPPGARGTGLRSVHAPPYENMARCRSEFVFRCNQLCRQEHMFVQSKLK